MNPRLIDLYEWIHSNCNAVNEGETYSATIKRLRRITYEKHTLFYNSSEGTISVGWISVVDHVYYTLTPPCRQLARVISAAAAAVHSRNLKIVNGYYLYILVRQRQRLYRKSGKARTAISLYFERHISIVSRLRLSNKFSNIVFDGAHDYHFTIKRIIE